MKESVRQKANEPHLQKSVSKISPSNKNESDNDDSSNLTTESEKTKMKKKIHLKLQKELQNNKYKLQEKVLSMIQIQQNPL